MAGSHSHNNFKSLSAVLLPNKSNLWERHFAVIFKHFGSDCNPPEADYRAKDGALIPVFICRRGNDTHYTLSADPAWLPAPGAVSLNDCRRKNRADRS